MQQLQPPSLPADPYAEWLMRVRRAFSRIGGALCVMIVIWYALATVLSGVLYTALHTANMPNWASYVASGAPLYLLAMPVAVLIMRKLTVVETRAFDMKPSLFLKLLVMCFPLMYVGSIIGNFLAEALSDGKASDAVSDLAMQLDVWNVVFLVIIGPIFEEWIFRKEIISRARRYGEKTAIVFSALAFGLFHMNLFQFFYAFALGLVFGYVYVRTSKLRYSIAMHMIINFNGGVLAPWVITRVDTRQMESMAEQLEGGNSAMATAWLEQNLPSLAVAGVYFVVYLAVLIAGVVLLVRERRRFEFYTAPEELPRGLRAKTACGNVGVITFIVLAVLLTAINLLA